MRTIRWIVIVALMSVTGCYGVSHTHTTSWVEIDPPPAPAHPVSVHVQVFYDNMNPYGEWVWVHPYGWVWYPYDVWVGWHPYTNGYWAYTEYGWTWVSNWDWGWGPFHYGRWVFVGAHGWVWVPGSVWGPAWVVWRHGHGYAGWAPMPPECGWHDGHFYHHHYDDTDRPREGTSYREGGGDYDPETHVDRSSWSFVRENAMGSERMNLEPAALNPRHLTRTTSATRYTVDNNGRVISSGISREEIEKASGRKIPVREVKAVSSPDETRSVRGNTVPVFRPTERATAARTERKTTDIPALNERHEQEKKQLDQLEKERRARLDERQQQERKAPPDGMTAEEVRKQHEAERRALEEQNKRERELLERFQERDAQKEIERRKTPSTRYRVTPEARSTPQTRTTPRPKATPKKTPTREAPKKDDESKRGKR